ncbi:MAG: hypothetical protein R2716_04830 [Microthrixaceae bacterium]
MERRTAIATAGGATLGLAAVVAAVAVNVGASPPEENPEGPGSFEPVSEQTTTSVTSTTLPEVTTVYVDENGNIVGPPGAPVPAQPAAQPANPPSDPQPAPSAGSNVPATPAGAASPAPSPAPAPQPAPVARQGQSHESEYEGHEDDDDHEGSVEDHEDHEDHEYEGLEDDD